MCHNDVMGSMLHKETLIDTPLSHSGREMLSGMSTKPSSVTPKEIKKFLKGGGEIKVLKARKTRRHNTRTKSHTFWSHS